MDLFAYSLVAGAAVLRHRYLTTRHRERAGYEVYCCSSPEGDAQSLRAIAERVLQENPHTISVSEVLDVQGQLQTSLQFFWRNALRLLLNSTLRSWRTHYRRELVSLGDGGTVALDWALCEDQEKQEVDSRPVVLLLHGILGDSQSEYLYHLVPQLVARGLRPVVLVSRGCGGLALTSPSTFSGRIPGDLCEVVQLLRARYGDAQKIFAMGFSLGAISLLHYLAHSGEQSGLSAAVAVSPMWDTHRAIMSEPSLLSATWSALLTLPAKLHLLTHWPALLAMDRDRFGAVDIFAVARALSLRDMDRALFRTFARVRIVRGEDGESVCAQTEGDYDDLDTVYRDVSAVHYAHLVATPTLVLCATDDPICPHLDCPTEDNNLHVGDSVVVVSVPFGGHLAFPQGLCVRHAWSDGVGADWLDAFR